MNKPSDPPQKPALQDPTSQNEFAVQKIAALAKLDPPNHAAIADQLGRIIEFVAVLDELALDDTEPFFGASELKADHAKQPLRRDVPEVPLPCEKALKNAPAPDGEFYAVPPVF